MKPITDKELRQALQTAEWGYNMARDSAKANPRSTMFKQIARAELATVLAVKRWIEDRKHKSTKPAAKVKP